MANEILSFFDDKYFEENSCGLLNLVDSEKSVTHQINILESANKTKEEANISQNRDTAKEEADSQLNLNEVSMIVHPVEINQSFPKQPSSEHLRNALEYRIKLIAPQNIVFQKGESRPIRTNVSITRKVAKLSMLLKPAENLILHNRDSQSFIDPNYRGPISVILQNPSSNRYYLASGTVIGYMILAPFQE
jgi:hypothetical protein